MRVLSMYGITSLKSSLHTYFCSRLVIFLLFGNGAADHANDETSLLQTGTPKWSILPETRKESRLVKTSTSVKFQINDATDKCTNEWATRLFGEGMLNQTQMVSRQVTSNRFMPFKNFSNYGGGRSIHRTGMFVFPSHRFAFCAIAKVSSSQWVTLMAKIAFNDTSILDKTLVDSVPLPKDKDIEAVFADPTATTAVMVREPLARFASAFFDKCNKTATDEGVEKEECPMKKPGEPGWSYLSVKDAVTWMLEHDPRTQEFHWMLQSEYCELRKRVHQFSVVMLYSKKRTGGDASCLLEAAGLQRFNSMGPAYNNTPFWTTQARECMDMPTLNREPSAASCTADDEEDILKLIFPPDVARRLMAHLQQDYDTFNIPEPSWIKDATGILYETPIIELESARKKLDHRAPHTAIVDGLSSTKHLILNDLTQPEKHIMNVLQTQAVRDAPKSQYFQQPFMLPVVMVAITTVTIMAIANMRTTATSEIKLGRYHFINLSSIMMLGPLSADAILASLPDIAATFHNADTALVGLSFQANLISRGTMMILFGWLSDQFGRKRLLLSSLTLHIGGSLLCLAALDDHMLLIARILQGLGEGGSSIVMAIVRDVHNDARQRVQAISVLTALEPMAVVLGPLVGSSIATYFGWRCVFAFLGIWGAVNFVSYAAIFPETNVSMKHKTLLKQFSEVLADRQTLSLAFNFALLFSLVFSMLSNIPFVLDGLGIGTYGRGWRIASIPPFVTVGVTMTRWLFARPGVDLLDVMRLAMFCQNFITCALTLVGLIVIQSQWAAMASFYAIALGMGMCVPTIMTLILDPLKDNSGFASGFVYSMQSIVGTFISAVVFIEREQHGNPAMFVGFLYITLFSQAVFWINSGGFEKMLKTVLLQFGSHATCWKKDNVQYRNDSEVCHESLPQWVCLLKKSMQSKWSRLRVGQS